MASITFKGNAVNTEGSLPEKGSTAPDFTLVKADLSQITLSELKGKKVVLNIFPSVDTGVCAASVRGFNQKASALNDTVVINASLDLPFAHGRFCGAEGIENTISASDFRTHSLAKGYGVTMSDGPLAGLYSRAVVVIDADGKVIYTEQVPEIAQEPNYDAALASLS